MPASFLLQLCHLRNVEVGLWVWSGFRWAKRGVSEISVASLQVFGKSEYNTISYSFLNAQPESQVGARCWGSGVGQWGKHWTCILQTWGQDPALLLLSNKEFVWFLSQVPGMELLKRLEFPE